MESISGPKPVIETPIPTARAAAVTTSIVAGQRAVIPVERTGASNYRADKPVTGAQLRQTLDKLEERLTVNVSFDIAFDESINREVVRGISNVTGEMVIEFPSEQMQKLIRGLRAELGLAVDQTA